MASLNMETTIKFDPAPTKEAMRLTGELLKLAQGVGERTALAIAPQLSAVVGLIAAGSCKLEPAS